MKRSLPNWMAPAALTAPVENVDAQEEQQEELWECAVDVSVDCWKRGVPELMFVCGHCERRCCAECWVASKDHTLGCDFTGCIECRWYVGIDKLIDDIANEGPRPPLRCTCVAKQS